MKGFLALFFLLLFCVDFTKSASCVALAKKLTVSYGTSCDLTSSLTGLDEVGISGTVNVQGSPGSTPLSLEATNIYVYSTGRILADGYGYGPMNGPGKGSSGGSGGKFIYILQQDYNSLLCIFSTLNVIDRHYLFLF